jgi:5-dehydro-2-deoxygluconokinase
LESEIGLDFGGLNEWPVDHVVKVLCFYHPDDDAKIRVEQEDTVQRLFVAARRNSLEFLLEVVPSKVAECNNETTAKIIQRFYDIGLYPDWWKLEPMRNDAAWQVTCATIQKNDPHCRGIVVLGLDAPTTHLSASFEAAAKYDLVKGFAVGRTIFADAAQQWLSGAISDGQAIDDMAKKYHALCAIWDESRNGAAE